MHLTTNALVLREVNYKESDKILTVLTQQEGKLTVSARGCRRKGSAIAAASQLLVWSEMTLYEYRGRWALREAATQRRFDGVRSDLDRLALASYFAEVTELLAEEGQPEPELLSLTLNCLHALDQMDLPLGQVKTAFEWRAMALAGYEPRTEGCAVCGRARPERPCLQLSQGVVRCEGCGGASGAMPLTDSALTALRHMVAGSPKRLFAIRTDPVSLERLCAASEAYLLTQMERGFRTLDFYQSLRRAGLGPARRPQGGEAHDATV
ncbi:MAG TPA: DNA repair protein RecO [Firmicutes bacterium]|nr:DNA repair protein RecO [Bacillota bacterium]